MLGALLVASSCLMGAWADEATILETTIPPWDYVEIGMAQRREYASNYGLVMDDAATAYLEREEESGVAKAVVYVDDAGCILYKIIIAGDDD